MTTVWVVVFGIEYEGYDRPDSVWSTANLAEAAAEKLRAKNGPYGWVDVLPYEVDNG